VTGLGLDPAIDVGGAVAYAAAEPNERRAGPSHSPLRECVRAKAEQGRDLLSVEKRSSRG
jgi:hypothetical protein